jgi:hypothetical protein
MSSKTDRVLYPRVRWIVAAEYYSLTLNESWRESFVVSCRLGRCRRAGYVSRTMEWYIIERNDAVCRDTGGLAVAWIAHSISRSSPLCVFLSLFLSRFPLDKWESTRLASISCDLLKTFLFTLCFCVVFCRNGRFSHLRIGSSFRILHPSKLK